MQWTAWITLAALAMYFWTGLNMGKARIKYEVPAPAMDGPIEFQRVARVQANALEQMAIFLPALWMCAFFVSDRWAALGGAVWVVGRIIYALGYYQAASRRSPGFGISMLASFALMTATAAGLIMNLK